MQLGQVKEENSRLKDRLRQAEDNAAAAVASRKPRESVDVASPPGEAL